MPKFLLTFFSLVLFITSFNTLAQTPRPGNSTQVNSIPTQIRMDTCLDKKFSVVVYLINDSLYNLTTPTTSFVAMTSYSLPQCFSKLNALFSPWCISFEHCKTVIIPNWTYNEWSASYNALNAIMEHNTVNTICLYVPVGMKASDIYDPPINSYAYTEDTVAPFRNAIVCVKGGLGGFPLYHAVGMFFGLPHTFDEINPTAITNPATPAGIVTKEFVNKSNSIIHGDGFSDTEADPYPLIGGQNLPLNSNLDCAQVSLKDGNLEYYTPPLENYMSHYAGCACKFSPQQYYSMVHYIMRKRMYLH